MRALRIVANLFQQKDGVKVKRLWKTQSWDYQFFNAFNFSHGCLIHLLQASTLFLNIPWESLMEIILHHMGVYYTLIKGNKKKKKENHIHVHFILCKFFLNNGDIEPWFFFLRLT